MTSKCGLAARVLYIQHRCGPVGGPACSLQVLCAHTCRRSAQALSWRRSSAAPLRFCWAPAWPDDGSLSMHPLQLQLQPLLLGGMNSL